MQSLPQVRPSCESLFSTLASFCLLPSLNVDIFTTSSGRGAESPRVSVDFSTSLAHVGAELVVVTSPLPVMDGLLESPLQDSMPSRVFTPRASEKPMDCKVPLFSGIGHSPVIPSMFSLNWILLFRLLLCTD